MPDDLDQRTGDLEAEIETLRQERDEAHALLAAARILLNLQSRLLTEAHGRYHLTGKAHTAIQEGRPA